MSTPSRSQADYSAPHPSSSTNSSSSTRSSSTTHRGSSSILSYALPPPHRSLVGDRVPAPKRPHAVTNTSGSSNRNSHYVTSSSSAGLHSPPRKAARLDAPSRPSISDRRDSYPSSSRRSDRLPTISRVDVPDPTLTIEKLVSLLQGQQDLSKETQEIQGKNAAVIKYLHRDDISKDNKVRAQKALDEVNAAKRSEALGWRRVEDQLKAVIDQLVKYMRDEQTAIRDFVADQWEEKNKQSARKEAPAPSVVPAKPSVRSPSLEPGELPASQPHNSAAPDPVSNKEKEKEVDEGDVAKLGNGKSLRAKRIMTRLDQVENDVLDTSERQDQMEAMMEELVRQEVEAQVEAFRAKRRERRARGDQSAQKDQQLQTKPSAALDSLPLAAAKGNSDSRPAEVVETPVVRGTGGVGSTAGQQVQEPHPLSRHARDEEPGMSREVALAFIESMRQEMRQEFDTKLYEQAKAHERALQEAMGQATASIYRDLQTITVAMQKHRDVLSNHGEALRRHEQILQGLLGTLSNIPRPHNVP